MESARRLVLIALAGLSPLTARAQVSEVEPNGVKAEATPALTLAPGGTISGSTTGAVTGAGLTSADSVDYWELQTTARPSPGWYQWTLQFSAGVVGTIRGLDLVGTVGVGAPPVPGSDEVLATSSTGSLPANILRWYSNEQPSRLFVRVAGSASSPTTYTGTLSVTPTTVLAVPGTFAPGPITITTIGQGHASDTELAVADASRLVIAGYQNDDAANYVGTQSNLVRTYTPGTYYVLVTNYDLNTINGASADEDFVLSESLDFQNAIVNSNTTDPVNLAFAIDDGSGPVAIPVSKNADFAIVVVQFTVGGGNLVSACNGDGGNQLGCTDCPCGNSASPGTLGGCINSASQSGRLIASGNPTIGSDTLHFDVTGGNVNTFAVLVSGANQLPQSGPCPPGSGNTSATLDGLRCVGGGLVRHGSRSLGAAGSTSAGWGPPANPAGGLAAQGGFSAGQTRHFQVFYRENPALGCTTGQNTTNSISVTFL